MKRSAFADSQNMDAVKRVELGISVTDLCKELGISTATFYKWRTKFGDMETLMIFKKKDLEEENRRLRGMYVEEKLMATIVAEAFAQKW
jgi:putative transposase